MSISVRGHTMTEKQLSVFIVTFNRVLAGELTREELDDALDDAFEAEGCPVPLDPPNYRPWAGEERYIRGVLKIRQQVRGADGEWQVEDGQAKWEWVERNSPEDRLANGEPW